MSLDIKVETERLRSMYLDDPAYTTFNALILGESGSGKTYLARTCRKPVHIDLFDPGGAKGLIDYIKSGDIIVDARYSLEDPRAPKAYELWKSEFKKRLDSGYFAHFGTYILDSSTTFSEAIMNWVLKKAGIAGDAPRFTHDYVPQKIELRNQLRKCLALPCDFILTGHLEAKEDVDDSGKTVLRFRFLTTGQGTVTIPLLFDELYVATTKASASGLDYRLLTKKTGAHIARTRIGKEAFDTYEKPDIKALLRKAGLPAEDKPKLF